MRHLGVLVVGQSPRPEIERELRRLITYARIELVGCLDDHDPDQLATLDPQDGETLFTRLPDGRGVTLPKSMVAEAGRERLDRLEGAGIDGILAMCTGGFPMWQGPRTLFAGDLLSGCVQALCPSGRLAVLVPMASQIESSIKRWSTPNHEVQAFALSPNATLEATEEMADIVVSTDPHLIVLDCVSYTRATKSRLCARTGKPAVLAVTAVARATAEWLERD